MNKPPRRPRSTSVPLPTKAQVLEFIQSSPGPVGKRELARAFNLTAEQRPFLTEILKGLGGSRRPTRENIPQDLPLGVLPDVSVIEAFALEADDVVLGRVVTHNHNPNLPHPSPPRIVILPPPAGQQAVTVGDRLLCYLDRLADHEPPSFTARVIRRLTTSTTRILAVVQLAADGLRLVPVEKRERQEYILDGGTKAKVGDLVEAEVMGGKRYGLKSARVLSVIGSMDGPKAVSLIAIHAHGIPTVFTEAALAQADAARNAPLGQRTDLRGTPLITIDGADARDFDDAVWAEADGEGWHLLVAIADVSHYVRPASPLDEAAHERGNSVYFPDRVVPMLPEALSNGWCSLKPNEERPCLAVHLWIDQTGNPLRHRFERGLMQSVARLTYEQVQAALDGNPDDLTAPLLGPLLHPLYGAFQALRAARQRRGALEIELPERKVLLGDDGQVLAISPRPVLEAHQLIEEFMVSANVAAAETLEAKRLPCMYRVHDEPSPEKIEALRTFLATLELGVPRGALSPKQFNHVLAKVKGTNNEALVNQVILRSQAQAIYGPENHGHFGLGLRRYAHFTSPIRRYADLLVHRALIQGLGVGEADEALPPHAGEIFAEIGAHLCLTERRAAAAERDSVDRYVAGFLTTRVGETFSGRVAGVGRFGLFVELQETGANGLIPMSMLPNDYYHYDEASHSLAGRSSGVVYRLGDAVTVRLRAASGVSGSLGLELLEGGSEREGSHQGGPRDGHKPASRPATKSSLKGRRRR